jgi:tRNA-splicing ligase RtcB (3'-phosphate/5'-hydroxy nucleic acid ligase)
MGARAPALEEVAPFEWELPQEAPMRVPGRVFASRRMIESGELANALEQVRNVASLPGIVRASYAMPDIHWGYGFPIGGVAAFDVAEGIVSPGGVGYDIGCGVRLIASDLRLGDARERLPALLHELSRSVPTGTGRGGELGVGKRDLERVTREGARWAVERGYGDKADLARSEDEGALADAEPGEVSERAYARGGNTLGSLGAGNHFLEIQVVEEIVRPDDAAELGLEDGQVCVMIHSGSRGLGHQVCTDFLREMERTASRERIELPDRQLASATFSGPVGRRYFGAMVAAANFARANRQIMTDQVRRSFERVFGRERHLELVYDVSHNIAKVERYGGRELVVHRKGATRSFPGQPVLIPGDMQRASWVLRGLGTSLERSFGSTCHGAGRVLGRREAKRRIPAHELKRQLEEAGVLVKAGKTALLVEEAPQAYKDVSEVVDICEGAGLSAKVARLRPLAVLKG